MARKWYGMKEFELHMASKMAKTEYEIANARRGLLHLESWAGHTTTPVRIVRETPKRFWVILDADCIKGKAGTSIYVPKHAIEELE